jgi:hypothetical protein
MTKDMVYPSKLVTLNIQPHTIVGNPQVNKIYTVLNIPLSLGPCKP